MIEHAVSLYGRLDAAFNNAGVNSAAAALLETSDDEEMGVKNYLIEGVPGTGKTAVCKELQRRGYQAIGRHSR